MSPFILSHFILVIHIFFFFVTIYSRVVQRRGAAMGVPALFAWLKNRYPSITSRIKEQVRAASWCGAVGQRGAGGRWEGNVLPTEAMSDDAPTSPTPVV